MQWNHHAGFTIALFAASSRCSAKCTLSKSCTIKVHSISACHSKMDKFPEKKKLWRGRRVISNPKIFIANLHKLTGVPYVNLRITLKIGPIQLSKCSWLLKGNLASFAQFCKLQQQSRDVFAAIPTQTFVHPRLNLLNPLKARFSPPLGSTCFGREAPSIWKCMQTVSLAAFECFDLLCTKEYMGTLRRHI